MKLSRKLLFASVASIIAGNSYAGFTLDGINTGGNEYDAPAVTQTWGFADDSGSIVGQVEGSMSWGFDNANDLIYVLLAAPTDFVDNVYGADSKLATSLWSTSHKGEHKFKELLGSDQVWFDVAYNDADGDVVTGDGINLDYIAKNAGTYEAEITSDKGNYDANGLIQGVASSLEYNLSLGTTCTDSAADPLNSKSNASCEDQLMYEFTLLQSDFEDANGKNTFALASLTNFTMHASPSMTGDHDFNPCEPGDCPDPTDPPNGVPEPSAFALMFAGLTGLLWNRRKKRKI